MEEENEYELARQQRIAANKAKLASLQVTDAVNDVADQLQKQREQDAAAKQAKRARAAATMPSRKRRTVSRAAAATARSKLKEHSDEEDGPNSAGEAAYDPFSGAEAVSSSSDGSEDASLQPSDEEDAPGAALRHRHVAPACGAQKLPQAQEPSEEDLYRWATEQHESEGVPGGDEDDDPDLQLALAMSMSAAADAPRGEPSAAPPSSSGLQKARVAVEQPTGSSGKGKLQISAGGSGVKSESKAKPESRAKPEGRSKKGSRGGQRGAASRAPTDEEVQAMYRLFNPQGMSAIIDSDIKKVASQTLYIEHEDETLDNMMVRACEVVGLDKRRLDPEAFAKLVRHFCG